MEDLYEIAGTSRQAVHRALHGEKDKDLLWAGLHDMVVEVRRDHPRMSARKIHKMLAIKEIGVNRMEQYCRDNGLNLSVRRNASITTRRGKIRFPNLTHGLKINGIDQLWDSDITYFHVGDKTYYLSFIKDTYSCQVLGQQASEDLRAIHNEKALEMAMRKRGKVKFPSLIHHSDQGSQYSSKKYLKKVEQADIQPSMAGNSLENPYAERVNGIIKNEYLHHWEIKNLTQLKRALNKAVRLYNSERPHLSLNYMTPLDFEQQLQKLPKEQRPEMQLYDHQTLAGDGFSRHKPKEYRKKYDGRNNTRKLRPSGVPTGRAIPQAVAPRQSRLPLDPTAKCNTMKQNLKNKVSTSK